MKNVTVTVQIQFDVSSDNRDQIKNEVIDQLVSMSQTLGRHHMEVSPVIFTNSIDESDIQVHGICKKYVDSEALPDEDGNCSLCGGNCVDEE